MKVPTKMWGKGRPDLALLSPEYRLNESPPKKEGKSALAREGMLGESDPQ